MERNVPWMNDLARSQRKMKRPIVSSLFNETQSEESLLDTITDIAQTACVGVGQFGDVVGLAALLAFLQVMPLT